MFSEKQKLVDYCRAVSGVLLDSFADQKHKFKLIRVLYERTYPFVFFCEEKDIDDGNIHPQLAYTSRNMLNYSNDKYGLESEDTFNFRTAQLIERLAQFISQQTISLEEDILLKNKWKKLSNEIYSID